MMECEVHRAGIGKKRGQKVAETKNNSELISFNWNPMRMNWNVCPFFIPLTSMLLCIFPQKPEPFKKLNTQTWPRSRTGWMRIRGRWSNCRSGLCPPARWAANWQQHMWYKMAAAVPSSSRSPGPSQWATHGIGASGKCSLIQPGLYRQSYGFSCSHV